MRMLGGSMPLPAVALSILSSAGESGYIAWYEIKDLISKGAKVGRIQFTSSA